MKQKVTTSLDHTTLRHMRRYCKLTGTPLAQLIAQMWVFYKDRLPYTMVFKLHTMKGVIRRLPPGRPRGRRKVAQ